MERENVECCVEFEAHPAVVEEVRSLLPEEETLADVADLFKVFGDSTRIRILFVLFEQEACVCDIATALNMTSSAISHQLRVLRDYHLIKNRKQGKQVLYSLADEHVKTIIGQGLEHVLE